MNKRQIILTSVIFFVASQQLSSQQLVPPPTTTGPYVVPQGQPALSGQPFLQGPPMVQQGAPPVPIYPPQSTVAPLPSQTPGSIFGPPQVQPLPPPGTIAPPGAVVAPQVGVPGQPVVSGPPNIVMVPVADEGLAWDQIVDVVSDYFPIAREQRARRSGEAWTEGRIETVPQTGATVLEPHKLDSVGSFNRWESTFQSIRRRAIVRVIPDPNGYLVEVIVEKELEDLPKPERGRVGPVSFGSELTLPSRRLERITRTHSSQRWIQLGRDPALEQRMLADIHARLNGMTAQGSIFAP